MYAQAQTAAEIDEIRAMTTKIADTDSGDNYVTKDSRVIFVLVDMMAFTGAYGHKTTLETKRTNLGFRNSFQAYSMMIATDQSENFWASWKNFPARNPVGDRPAAAAAPRPVSVLALQADSDDEAMLQADDGGGGGGGAVSNEDAGWRPGPAGRRPGPLQRRLLHRRPGPVAGLPSPAAGPPRPGPPRLPAGPTRMINRMLWCLQAVDWIEDTDTRTGA
jgi:hypothetical protein